MAKKAARKGKTAKKPAKRKVAAPVPQTTGAICPSDSPPGAVGTPVQPTAQRTPIKVEQFGLQINPADPGATVPLVDLNKLAADVLAMGKQLDAMYLMVHGTSLDGKAAFENPVLKRLDALEAMHPLASVFEMDGHDDSDHEHVQDFAIGIPGKSYPRPFQSMPTKLAVDIAKLTDTAAAFNDRIAALEAAVKEVRPWTAKDEARCPTPVPNPEPVPVDVAALCKRHGLAAAGRIFWVKIGTGYMGVHGPGTINRKQPNGSWFWYANKSDGQITDSGSIDTLAAALERYCPVKDVVATDTFNDDGVDVTVERKASGAERVVSAKIPAATAEERAALCEAWGLEKCADGYYNIFEGGPPRGFSVDTKNGWILDGSKVCAGPAPHTTTLADLEAVFRQHLPYDREWREKVAKKAGWYDHGPKPSGHLWSIRNNVNCAVFVLPDRGEVAIGCDSITPLPDRAAWLKFIRDNTPAKPTLVGDGPWTVEQLNAAGIECWYAPEIPAWILKDVRGFTGESGFCVAVPVADRRRLLHAANDPDVNPEWAAKVKAALGENNA